MSPRTRAIKPAMYWVELQRVGSPSLYVQEKGESIVGAGFLAMERMRKIGYDPDEFTRVGLVDRPPPRSSQDMVFHYEKRSEEIHRALRRCSNCDKIVPITVTCLNCGFIPDAELNILIKNVK